jgi:hypothetical protein
VVGKVRIKVQGAVVVVKGSGDSVGSPGVRTLFRWGGPRRPRPRHHRHANDVPA